MNIYSAKKEREKYLREKQNDREKQIYNKPLNNYQQFIRDNQERIEEEFPELSYTERFSKLAALWKLEKNSNKISPKEKHIYNKPINNYQQFIRDNQKKVISSLYIQKPVHCMAKEKLVWEWILEM